MGKKAKNCIPLNGILPLDKQAGLTSNKALQQAKHLLRACKAGHTGSIDPMATGLMLLCFGEATKISQFILDADKRYWAVFQLGVSTNSYDSEGEVLQRQAVTLDRKKVEKALQGYIGNISQIPPMYSAIKQGGQPLYKLARQGIEVEREPRKVTIHDITLLDFDDDRLELEVHCSKGTYIRSLANDLGLALSCGAHVASLRRLQVGPFHIDQAITMEELREMVPEQQRTQLLPMDTALKDFPEVTLTELATHYLLQGQPVSVQHGYQPGWVRLYADGQQFLGMGQVLDDGRVAPKRLMHMAQKS